MGKDVEQPLLWREYARNDSDGEQLREPRRRWRVTLETSVALNFVLCFISCVFGVALLLKLQETPNSRLFSPAQDAIEYTTTVFRSGLPGDRTEYQGATEEVMQKWKAMYDDVAMTQIDKATAKKLPNATAPASFDQSKYVIQLDVFHTLHCLNILRKRLYPDVYPPNDHGEDGIDHLEHCIEQIRQSLVCFSDVSTISWEWNERTQRMLGNTRSTHTCRNFEKIHDWALKHTLPQKDDFLQHVPGSPIMQDYLDVNN